MKYIVHSAVDPVTGAELEKQPEELQEWINKWQALKPIGMYFGLTSRAVTIILDEPDEDAIFEALHSTWVLTKSYPEVWPVADASEFPALMKRLPSA